MIKMNTLLAKAEHSAASFAKLLKDYAVFFIKNQGAFTGEKKTFVAREGFVEDPSKMGNRTIITTVDEKIDWFGPQFAEYLYDIFSIEATNAAGAKTVELVVDGESFGHLTALDLMRLKNILVNKDLETVFANIPVRSDAEIWEPTTNAEYKGRTVFETPLEKGVTRTTEKEEVILKDPNLDPAHLPANYNARTTIKSKIVETGDYTRQKFSGEWTQRQRAELLRRRSQLLEAVIKALKDVNDAEALKPNLDINSFINYIING